jgi:hypothetical protein
MKYALLLYQDRAFEAQWDAMGDDERAAVLAEFARFDEAATATGATILGGNELGLSHTATTVRRDATAVDRRGDEVTVTDGPFAEVAEHLGGYFEIEARDLDHAIEVAKLVPNGTTEIRPIVEYEGQG